MTAVGMDFGFSAPRSATSRSATSRSVAQRSHLRLTNRGRAVLLALVTIPLVIAAALFALNGGAATASQDELVAGVTYEYVTVEPGGSLWAIAQEVAPASDPRDVIADILSFNGMSSAELFPGQQLALPPKYETGE